MKIKFKTPPHTFKILLAIELIALAYIHYQPYARQEEAVSQWVTTRFVAEMNQEASDSMVYRDAVMRDSLLVPWSQAFEKLYADLPKWDLMDTLYKMYQGGWAISLQSADTLYHFSGVQSPYLRFLPLLENEHALWIDSSEYGIKKCSAYYNGNKGLIVFVRQATQNRNNPGAMYTDGLTFQHELLHRYLDKNHWTIEQEHHFIDSIARLSLNFVGYQYVN
jgi:hypothetical protein